MIQEPLLIKNLFSEEEFLNIKNKLFSTPREQWQYCNYFGRYSFDDKIIFEYHKNLLPLARKLFKSDTLIPSYPYFAHYQGDAANLYKHKDDNACTYTIDMCLYQNEPWDLWVEDKPYTLQENEALIYYGNDQLHWRDKFPNPSSQYVAMIFFHYAEPDHWYFTKGEEYLSVIRGEITEEDWNNNSNITAV